MSRDIIVGFQVVHYICIPFDCLARQDMQYQKESKLVECIVVSEKRSGIVS